MTCSTSGFPAANLVASCVPLQSLRHSPADPAQPRQRGSVCRTTEIYDPFRDVWEAGPLLPGLMAAPFSFAGGAATRTGVFVVGGATHSVSVARLDRKSRVWHPAAQPAVPRVHCAVAALPEALFLLVRA